MNVNSVEQYNNNSTKSLTKEKNSNINKDAFLNLMVKQLQYQDPLNPTQDKEFLAQMAQFTALEQMQNLNSSTKFMHTVQMIGKEIEALIKNEDTYEYEQIKGVVQSVRQDSGKYYLDVGNREVSLEDVIVVENINTEKNANTNDNINKDKE